MGEVWTERRKPLYRLISYVRPYWKLAVFSLFLLFMATLLGLTPPLIMSMLIDDVIAPSIRNSKVGSKVPLLQLKTRPVSARNREDPEPNLTVRANKSKLAVLIGFLLLVIFFKNSIAAFRSFLLARLGQQITYDLRNQVYHHVHHLSLSFYHKRETGRIIHHLTQEVRRLQDFLSDGLQEGVGNTLTLIIICIILFSLNASLAVLVILPLLLILPTTVYFGRRVNLVYPGVLRQLSMLSSALADVIPGIRVIKAFSLEKREVNRLKRDKLEIVGARTAISKDSQRFSSRINPSYDIRHCHHLVGW